MNNRKDNNQKNQTNTNTGMKHSPNLHQTGQQKNTSNQQNTHQQGGMIRSPNLNSQDAPRRGPGKK